MNKDLAAKITIKALEETAKRQGFKVFKSIGGKDYNLNIWQIRANNQKAGSFDDVQAVFWHHNGVWILKLYPITCDPSDIALIAKKNPLGVAIVKPGQYSKVWKRGLHRGDYKALVQRGEFTVIRDFNKDGILDWNVPDYDTKKVYKRTGIVTDYYKDNKLVFREEKGDNFGINCHRASKWKVLDRVGLYSEGCTVHQNPNLYDEFISIIDSACDVWGDEFSTTFATEKMFDV